MSKCALIEDGEIATRRPHDRTDSSPDLYGDYLKPVMDRCLGAMLLVIVAPVLLLALLLVKLTSRGPAIYTQQRLGRHGRVFTLYKIRSMRVDSEKFSGPTWCVPGDPRITPIGSFLRKSHIDELPQLWNVIWGDLSLVGPRPERPSLASKIEAELPEFRRRLEVKPGLTGLAQVQQAPDENLDTVRRKLQYDAFYISRVSLLFDLRIMFSTPLYILGVPSRQIASMFHYPVFTDRTQAPQRRRASFHALATQDLTPALSSDS